MTQSNPQTVATLSKVSLFSQFSPTELEMLARLMSKRDLRTGELIFNEGDECQGLFVVEAGAVRIFKTSSSGREQVLAVERTGGIIAELPVFDDGPYPASASAAAETTLLFLSKPDFRAICIEHPEVAIKVLRAVGRRLRSLVALIEELSFTTVRQRLASLLLRLAEREGTKTSDGVAVILPTNQEIGSQIGTVRELVSRNLSRFQAEGTIRMDGKLVIILEPEILKQHAEAEG